MEDLVLAVVFKTVVDKNGTPMRCGKTADYRDASGRIHFGQTVTTYTESIFEHFVVGAKIAPLA